MNLQQHSRAIRIVFILATAFLLVSLFPTPAHSQTSKEIQEEIEDQNEQLQNTKKTIEELKKQIEQNKKDAESASEGLPSLLKQLEAIELELKLNDQRLNELEQENQLKLSLLKRLKIEQENSISESYKQWRVKGNDIYHLFEDLNEFQKYEFYQSAVIGSNQYDSAILNTEIQSLENSINQKSETVATLAKQKEEIEAKKAELEKTIAYYNSLLASNNSNINNLESQMYSIEKKISALLTEQQEAARREAEIINNPPGDGEGPGDVITGGFYFTGSGRDLYQGHGVGMSQWGAYGAALNAGWNAQQIITFYYSGSSLGTLPSRTINVSGYGTMDINTYVAGLGEVPDKACGNSQQATERPDKYVIDNTSTVWDCWPEEAIKAQVIAARSYAGRYNGTICTTAACQVYKGGTAKQWAANETKDQYALAGGQIVNALYSSDNSQGYGTANNDTIFQSFNGDGWPVSYLRSVNDSAFASKTSYTNWGYKTGNYNLNHLYEMFYFTGYDPSSTASNSTKSYVKSFISGVTSFTNIEFERDPSKRVKKVWLTTQTGEKRSIGGWWFKIVWNGWTYDKGWGDYLYSQTFFLNNN